MKNSSSAFLGVRALARAGLASALAAIMLGAPVPRLAAQSADFNAGNDTGWTRYSLPDLPGFLGAAAFSFPPDDSGGQAYRISAPPTKDDPYGIMNARAGSYRTDVTYSGRFSVGVDLLGWNATWRQEAGLLFYFQDINLGASDGYTATYSSGYQQLYISLINNEIATTIAELGTGAIVLDPTHRYRLVASSHDGYTFLFQLFDKSQPDSPWVSAIGQDATYNSGLCGVFTYEQTYPSDTEGADATFDNYVATVPVAGGLPATVTDLTPPPGGNATAVYPTVTAAILDRDTTVDPGSIVLYLDGVVIPSASLTVDLLVHKPANPSSGPREFSGATVSYPIPNLLPWGSQHTNRITFVDSASVRRTNTWVWTTAYPYLFASNSLPLGSLNVRGFDVRMVQSANQGNTLDNTLARARQQLAIPPTIPVDLTATSLVQLLSWDKTGTPTNVPGLCPGSYINIAVESLAYLELTAGVHRFHIRSDDRAGLYSGAGLADTNALALWENPGNTADSTFDFVVEADGLYPVRSLWEETGGGAHFYLSSVNLGDLSEVPINDPGNPAGVIKAWYPLACRSAATVTGPYTVDATAVGVLTTADIVGTDCSPTVVGQRVTGGTFTVPLSGTTRYYRLDSPRATRITNFSKSGLNAVITCQVH